jgi:hypothetical protein
MSWAVVLPCAPPVLLLLVIVFTEAQKRSDRGQKNFAAASRNVRI